MSYQSRARAIIEEWEDGGLLPPLPYLQALIAALAESGEPIDKFRRELLACVSGSPQRDP